MRISGLTITSPDVAATQDAWRRLGTLDREIEVTPGEGGLAAVVLGVDDVAATERLLQRRGLVGDADGFDLGGLTWRLAPFVEGEGIPSSTDLVLDHVVVRTGDAERAAADLGARVGLDLRLDRRLMEHGFRGLFFRCGDAVVEVAAPIEPTGDPDSFGGLAWRSANIEATRERLVAGGVEVSEVRTGRKPGTRVATVRDRALGTPTLIIEQG
ncbi:VOC family protein [Janibacter sp. YB324]|uniref:VOC family protein n=1 Tax=Janibacter sp. YB324 TaxID=2761047 RepID=UPI001CB9778A|nr:VOC family protein [Janibacter sp. YB324]